MPPTPLPTSPATLSRYAALDHATLAVLVPELLLTGHLIDRAGMAFCIEKFGIDGMTKVAIDEWAAASPIYTRRMQAALDFVGTDVATIFKGMQLEIGAPPQFMDFRYEVTDAHHGAFHLDHCGALMDVEPMGEAYVKKMCHDIEDPTFDATAVATNPKAQVRPLHRPPRTPADRTPHCAWTVVIDPHADDVQPHPNLARNSEHLAAGVELAPIDLTEEGRGDYSGPLLGDIDFTAFSHSALVRIADEVCLQMHLLNLAFHLSVRELSGPGAEGEATFDYVASRQFVGHAGLTAGRIHRALTPRLLGASTREQAARVLELHPAFNPSAYVVARREGELLHVQSSPAHIDGAWLRWCGPDHLEALQAMVRAVDPHLDVEVIGTATDWTATVVERAEPAREAGPVQVAKFSTGATFEFGERTSLPLYVL